MKVLLYTEVEKIVAKAGIGKAIKHQQKALKSAHVSYTLDPRDDYDVVHLNLYGLRSYFLARYCHRKGIKVVYHAHSTEEDFRNSFVLSNQIAPTFRTWITTCYKQGDYIITPTPYAKRLLENYGLKQPITAISNGIDLDFFSPSKAEKIFRKKYGFKKDDVVIVGIGLYIERKGILDFVELARRMPEYQFVWFGHLNKAVVPDKIRKVLNINLPNLIFPGYVEPTMIRSALNEADLYIFPTLEETEGIPAMEACAMKCDAIIRDIPVFDEWLEDGVNIYKAKDIDDFEIKIKKIINKELPSLVEEGYKVAQSRDIKKVGEQLKGVYEEVLKVKTP